MGFAGPPAKGCGVKRARLELGRRRPEDSLPGRSLADPQPAGLGEGVHGISRGSSSRGRSQGRRPPRRSLSRAGPRSRTRACRFAPWLHGSPARPTLRPAVGRGLVLGLRGSLGRAGSLAARGVTPFPAQEAPSRAGGWRGGGLPCLRSLLREGRGPFSGAGGRKPSPPLCPQAASSSSSASPRGPFTRPLAG